MKIYSIIEDTQAKLQVRNSPSSEGVDSRNTVETGRGSLKQKFTLPYNPQLKERANLLRKAGNLSEVLLWNELKIKKLNRLDFDRQRIIGNYIVDFFCFKCRLVIEIDGSSHDNKVEYDKLRTDYLESLGLKVLKFTDKDVKNNLDNVLNIILEQTTPSSPDAEYTPSKEGES